MAGVTSASYAVSPEVEQNQNNGSDLESNKSIQFNQGSGSLGSFRIQRGRIRVHSGEFKSRIFNELSVSSSVTNAPSISRDSVETLSFSEEIVRIIAIRPESWDEVLPIFFQSTGYNSVSKRSGMV